MPKTFNPAPGAPLLLSAHTGDSFPASEQPIDPARIVSLTATEWRMLGKATYAPVKVQPGGQYFAIHSKPRLIEMEADKFRAYLKEEGLNQVLQNFAGLKGRELYSKYAKTYVVAGEPKGEFSKALGLKIEIVPLADPAQAQPGAKLPVQVLFEGKPLEGVQIEIASKGHKIAGRTDGQGRLDIEIEECGPTRLHAVHMVPVKEASHDWESYWASFTFAVPEAKR